jgi:glycine cleavage system pyridoxal-binding protein P
MEIANASLLDESTAAMALLFDVRSEIKEKQCKFFVSEEYYHRLYPFYKLVLNLSE